MANKTKKQTDENILYIQDIDAKVLGIVEGSAQKVYIDNREVEVVIMDEYEIIPAPADERKLYQDANKIAANYIGVFDNIGKLGNRNIVESKNLSASLTKSKIDKFDQEIGNFKDDISQSDKNLGKNKKANNNLKSSTIHSKFLDNNNAFTREELLIVKNILANKASKANANESNQPLKALTTDKKPQSLMIKKTKKK